MYMYNVHVWLAPSQTTSLQRANDFLRMLEDRFMALGQLERIIPNAFSLQPSLSAVVSLIVR